MNKYLPQSLRWPRPEILDERLYTPGEVAKMFHVDPKTVVKWAKAELISAVRTPGGHRRFRESEVRRIYESGGGVWK